MSPMYVTIFILSIGEKKEEESSRRQTTRSFLPLNLQNKDHYGACTLNALQPSRSEKQFRVVTRCDAYHTPTGVGILSNHVLHLPNRFTYNQ